MSSKNTNSNTQKTNKTMKQAVQKATAKKITKVIEQKAKQIATQKAIQPVAKQVAQQIKKEERKDNRTFLQKVGDVAGKAWHWLKEEGGWETLLTVGSLLALTNEGNKHKYTKHLVGKDFDGTMSAGTVIAKIPISASMFDDVNDRLQKQLSLYTYYSFLNSSIHFKGAQGDLVNGMIGMFLVPDPDLSLSTTDSASIVRLIREYGGRTCKLNETCSIRIPNAVQTLTVQPGMTDEKRTFVQSTLYIVAVTDLSYDGALGEFAIKFDVEMSKNANTGLESVPDPTLSIQQAVMGNFPDLGDTDSSLIATYKQPASTTLGTLVPVNNLGPASKQFFDVSSGYVRLPPGIYKLSADFFSAFTTNNLTDTYDIRLVFTLGTNPSAEYDPTTSTCKQKFYTFTGTTVGFLPMINNVEVNTFVVLEQSEYVYVGLGPGFMATLDEHLYLIGLTLTVEQIQQFPVDDYPYSLNGTTMNTHFERYVPPYKWEDTKIKVVKELQKLETAPTAGKVGLRRLSQAPGEK